MTSRFMRWLHARRATATQRRADAEQRAAHAARLASLDIQRRQLQDRARSFYAAAQIGSYPERCRLYHLALAADARAEALHWRMGGDEETALIWTRDAEDYERRAGEPRPVAAPQEAAHA
jgi:hypothetical protein